LFIITEGEFREEIERVLPTLPQAPNLHFHYLPVSDRVRRMCWNQGDWRFYFHYRRWQKRALALAREICATESIDLIHQLNMVGFREPGLLWKIQEVPFILGPTNCKFEFPLAYWKDAPVAEKIRIGLKEVISRIQLRFSPSVRGALRRASAIITASSDAQRLFKKYARAESVMINETGAFPFSGVPRPVHEGLEVLWVGRLNLYSKLPALAIGALKQAGNPGIRLHFIGPGDDSVLREKAERLGVADRCVWHGQVSHAQVGELMKVSDALLFTSVVEGTPHVVLEAVSYGLPVICFDTCGQGDIVDDRVGIKIPLSNPDQSETDFADALNTLYNQPGRREDMFEACRERSSELSWDSKVSQVIAIYRTVCNL
jgi:glycosyltransferase involved in cell wall biosynthesis